MAHKLEKMLLRIVNRLPRIHTGRSSIYVIKQNFCCSVLQWNKNELLPGNNAQPCRLLHEIRTSYGTKKDCSRGRMIIENKDKQLVYYGSFTSKIKTLKVVSYVTSLIGLMAQPIIYNKIMSLGAPAMVSLYVIMGFSTFVSPLLIHFVTKKYVTEIMYDPFMDVYVLKTMTFWLQEKPVSFKLEEVQFNPTASLFNSLIVKGKPYMIFQEGMLVKDHYVKLLGFDKPIDLKMSEDSMKSQSSDIKSGAQE